MTLVVFLLVLSLLVLFHEFGHFLTARLFKMKVEEFGIGFPPRAKMFQVGDTPVSINWIPLGGFVRIKGENGGKGDADSFAAKPLWQKAIVLVAGVTMNIVLAVLLFWVAFMIGLPMPTESIEPGTAVRDRAVYIERVVANAPAAQAGIKAGDKIISINGQPLSQAQDFTAFTGTLTEPTNIAITIQSPEERTVTVTTQQRPESDKQWLGVGLVETGVVSYGPIKAFGQAVKATWFATLGIFAAFGDLLKNLFTQGKVSADVSGPLGIAVMTGQVAKMGFTYLLQFAAMLSINLAILNILPFPALDGGRLLFVIIEKIRGKAVSAQIEGMVHGLGFLLLMSLVIVVTLKDLKGLFGM